jgi:formylglycine-generating enzyme required for sulfatase activity
VNAAQLYRAYTDLWLERDVGQGRVLLTPEQRRAFAEELAMVMLHSGELRVHFSRLPDRVASHFGLQDAEQIDYFATDVRTCNFLNRDTKGNYTFAHKSFMEFFAASRLHRLMLRDRATVNGPVKINEEVRLFLHGLFALEPKMEAEPPHVPPEGFVWVPPGEFIQGGPGGSEIQVARLHEGVFVARYPVTNAEYARFVDAKNYPSPQHWEGRTPSPSIAIHPVVYVDWIDAVAYADWIGCRLPTEQEWEKAARGVDGRVYPWGDEPDEEYCNTREGNSHGTMPVGSYPSGSNSPYEVSDMAGNIWEWMGTERERLHRLRGGAWNFSLAYAHCAFRRGAFSDYKTASFGFRVVLPLLEH